MASKNNLFKSIGEKAGDLAGKSKELAAHVQESVVHTLDKNNDGVIGKEDFKIDDAHVVKVKDAAVKVVDGTKHVLKEGQQKIGQAFADAKEERERKTLQPVFLEELHLATNNLSSSIHTDLQRHRIIRIVSRDKKRDESVVCQGAVGYREIVKGMEVLSIYEDCATQLGVWFHPYVHQTFYYMNPYQKDLYISLDEYFSYFKKERVNELEMIAQQLGAKRVKIAFREHTKGFVKKSVQAGGQAKKIGVEVNGVHSQQENMGLEVATDIKFSGHNEPTVPQLVYFKHEGDIKKLIKMRTENADNQLQSKTYRFQCSKSSGLDERTAGQIDSTLKILKCNGNTSFAIESQRESRTELEYYIEF